MLIHTINNAQFSRIYVVAIINANRFTFSQLIAIMTKIPLKCRNLHQHREVPIGIDIEFNFFVLRADYVTIFIHLGNIIGARLDVFAICECTQRQAAHRHEDRDNHGQQALQTSRFLHVITPFFRFVFIPKHWPPIPHMMTSYV